MKNNIYTDSVSKISTPDEVLQKGLESIRSTEPTNEVINFKEAKAKKNWFKPIGAVAALLAVVIGLSTVGITSENEGNTAISNPFIITANAQELNTKTYVRIGDVDLVNIPGSITINPDDFSDVSLEALAPEFNFNVVCTGEGIETVTYSTSTGWFNVDKQLEGLVDYVPLNFDEQKKFFGGLTGNNNIVSTCVFDYDHQPKSSAPYKLPDDVRDGTIPLVIAFNIHDAKELYESNPEKYGLNLTEMMGHGELAAKLFNDSAYTYNAEITANFTDGSTTTQKLEFKCDYDENGCYLVAKIVE